MVTGSSHGNKNRPGGRSALQATLRAAPSSMSFERVRWLPTSRVHIEEGPTGSVADMTYTTASLLAGPIFIPMGGLLNL